jgi:hypothetical protein
MTKDHPPIDVLASARAILLTHRRATRVSVEEARALSQAVLDLDEALRACRLTDSSALYDPGEARPDGALPDGECWATPREIATSILGRPKR